LPALRAHLRELWVGLGIGAAGTIGFYVVLLYMPTFASTQLHLPLDQAFIAQSLALLCMIVIIPFSGALSDRVGRKPIFIVALTCYIAIAYPLFAWVQAAPSFGRLAVMQIVFCSLLGVPSARWRRSLRTVSDRRKVHLPEHWLQSSRHDFRGFAQFIVTFLIQATGSPVAPAYYLMFGSAMGLLGSLSLREHCPTANYGATTAQTIPADDYRAGLMLRTQNRITNATKAGTTASPKLTVAIAPADAQTSVVKPRKASRMRDEVWRLRNWLRLA
jgi:MFS family permease